MDSDKQNCVFCGVDCERISTPGLGGHRYECKNCGNYHLDDIAESAVELKYRDKKHILAGYLYNTKEQRSKTILRGVEGKKLIEALEFTTDRLEAALSDAIVPKTVIQKLDFLLVYIYKKTNRIGEMLSQNIIERSAVYAIDSNEVLDMLKELYRLGYIELHDPTPAKPGYIHVKYKMISAGFERAERLISTNAESRKVFVAMGFKDDLLVAMNKAIRPACIDCGFDAYLISDKEHNNGITDEIIVAIKTSKFIITDFTYNNCGAYFEAGYAQGYGLEVIRCCKKEWFDGSDECGNKNRLHFDVSHYNFILWEDEDDLRTKLKNRIRAIVPEAKMEDKEANGLTP